MISPDGRWILSSSFKTLVLLELSTGKCLRRFEGHTHEVNSVAISPDGRWGLSGSEDKTLRLWELATGNCLRTFDGHTKGVGSVAISSDGRWGLSAGGIDATLRLWELATGRCLHTFADKNVWVNSVAISPDGRWGLSGSSDSRLRLWALDWEYEFPGWSDWDEGARPYLTNFLTLHTPYAAHLPGHSWWWGKPSPAEVALALTRKGRPDWTEDDFEQLLYTLGCAGYGWLKPEGVKRELEKMAAAWDGPPPLVQLVVRH